MIKKAKKFQVRITHKSFGALMRANPHALRKGRLGPAENQDGGYFVLSSLH